MLDMQISIPAELQDVVEWFIETASPLTAENGWQITFNGNSGTIQADVRVVEHSVTARGDKRRTEIRSTREFRLKRPRK